MSSEKRYQIFISSTYEDLKAERKAVFEKIVKMKNMPEGMENFPASNRPPFEYIKRMIDESDYYILIIGGRYGSLDEDGVGYTEKEFIYAEERKIPILVFVHQSPENLPEKKRETTSKNQKLFKDFKKKAEKYLRCSWQTRNKLAEYVETSLKAAYTTDPATGWVRADSQTIDGSKHSEDIKEIEPEEIIDIPLKIKELKEKTLIFTYHRKDYVSNSGDIGLLPISLFDFFSKIKHFFITNKDEQIVIDKFNKILCDQVVNIHKENIHFKDGEIYRLLTILKEYNLLVAVDSTGLWGLTSLGNKIANSKSLP